jgi:UDP:flavonoid glycosyltransferase YjiC (YdhE family)
MLTHLQDLGHHLMVVSYDRGYANLKDDFDVFETEGLHIASLDNRVSRVKTFTDNLQRLPKGHKKLQMLRKDLANHYDLPLITIDNQHRLRYMSYPCPAHLQTERRMTITIIRAMVPRPDVSLVTTFYCGEPKNERTYFFPPILRKEVLSLQPFFGEHILVYLTSGFETFLKRLKSFKRESFIVYGAGKEGSDGHLTFKSFSKAGFLNDLASCKAVMATAGFTLMTESFYLRKPYLALPMHGQFEQEINAFLLARLKYGINLRRTNSEAVGHFLYCLPDFVKNLKTYQARDNSAIKDRLAELLDDNCALAKEFHRKRARLLP